MTFDKRLTSLGIVDLGVPGVFRFPVVVILGVPSFFALWVPGKFTPGFPIKLFLEFPMDTCSLYYALLCLDLNLSFNQAYELALT